MEARIEKCISVIGGKDSFLCASVLDVVSNIDWSVYVGRWIVIPNNHFVPAWLCSIVCEGLGRVVYGRPANHVVKYGHGSGWMLEKHLRGLGIRVAVQLQFGP